MFRVFTIPSPPDVVAFVLVGNKRGQSSSSEVEVWVLTITLFSSTLTVSRFSLISPLFCLLGDVPVSSCLVLLFRKLQRKLQMLEKRSPRQEQPQIPAKMVHIWGRHSSTTPACLSLAPVACPLCPPGNSGMPGMEGEFGVPWASPTLPSISPPAASLLKQECKASIGEFLLLDTKSFLPTLLAYFLLGLGD